MRPTALALALVALLAGPALAEDPLGAFDLEGPWTGRARVERDGAALVLRARVAGQAGERVLRATPPAGATRWTFRGRSGGDGAGISGTLGQLGGGPGAGAGVEVVLDLAREADGSFAGPLRVGAAAPGRERLRPTAGELGARLVADGPTRFQPHRRGGAGVDLRLLAAPTGTPLDVAVRVVDRTGAVAFTHTLRGVTDDGLGVAWRWDGRLLTAAAGYADPRKGPYRVTATARRASTAPAAAGAPSATSEAVEVTPVPVVDAVVVASRVRPTDDLTTRSKIVGFADRPLVTAVVRAVVAGARVDQPGRTARAYFVVVDGVARATLDGVGLVALTRWDDAAWGGLTLEWQTIHALGLHAPAYRATQNAARATRDGEFTNVVSNGPDEGRWLGRDTLEYRHEAAGRGPSPRVSEAPGTVRYRVDVDHADAALALGEARPGSAGRRDPTPTTAAAAKSGLLDGVDADLAGASPRIHRISRRGDQASPLLAMIEAYRGVPWLYGSLGPQAQHFVGFDCADLVFAAARHAGLTQRTEFTNANNFCKVYARPRGAERIYAFDAAGGTYDAKTRAPVTIACGEASDATPRPGDLVFFDWDGDGQWDHTTVLWATDGDVLDAGARFVWAHHEATSTDGVYVGTLRQLVGASPRASIRMTIRRF